MGSVIFVHGTSVREESFKQSLSKVGEKLLARRADMTLIPCFWGEKFGSNANGKLRSVPVESSWRSPESLGDEDYDAGVWGLLYEDPLYELRVLSLQPKQVNVVAPNELSPYQKLAWAVKKIGIEGELEQALSNYGLRAIWDEALQKVVSSKDYLTALRNVPAMTDEISQAIARAFVAQAMLMVCDQQKFPDGVAPISAEERDHLVDLLVQQLGMHRSALGWLTKQIVGRPATFFVRRNRAEISESAYPAVGDILLYQVRGKAIRDCIHEAIKMAKSPVILLAHSLGGIACVELLILESLPEVKLLITAGSQSPLFYEIGALGSLESGKPLPDHFPKHWLNLYDPRDFLGYVAEPVFPASPARKIMDVRVNNKEPFPQSHTSYWNTDAVWDEISIELNEVLQ